MWNSIYYVAKVPSICFFRLKWFSGPFLPVLSFAKYLITNCVRPIANFPLLVSLILSIIKIIISSYFSVVLFPALTILWIALWGVVYLILICGALFVYHIQFQGPQLMLRVFHKVGNHKLSCIYFHYFPSDLSNTIFPVQSYQFLTLTPILKFC